MIFIQSQLPMEIQECQIFTLPILFYPAHPRPQANALPTHKAHESEYAEIQDVVSRTFSSDEEHTYAGIGSLDSSMDGSAIDPYSHPYHLPHSPKIPLSPHGNGPPLEALYAQVNKPRNGHPALPDR